MIDYDYDKHVTPYIKFERRKNGWQYEQIVVEPKPVETELLIKTPFSQFGLNTNAVTGIHEHGKIVHNANVSEVCGFPNTKDNATFHRLLRSPNTFGVIIYPTKIFVIINAPGYYQGSHARNVIALTRDGNFIESTITSYGQARKFYKLRGATFITGYNRVCTKPRYKPAAIETPPFVDILKARVAKMAVTKLTPTAVEKIGDLCRDGRFADARDTLKFLEDVSQSPLRLGQYYITDQGHSHSLGREIAGVSGYVNRRNKLRDITFDYIERTEKALNKALYGSIVDKLEQSY